MKIAVTAMGGDFTPLHFIKGVNRTDIFPDGVTGSVDPTLVLMESLHSNDADKSSISINTKRNWTLGSVTHYTHHIIESEPADTMCENENNFILSLKMGESNLHLRLENETHNNNDKQ